MRGGRHRQVARTCPAIRAGVLAAQKGVPFVPIRGLPGSDMLRLRPDWQAVDNPFATGDSFMLIPAIRPDVAIFHASMADRNGKVWIGRRRELAAMAHALVQVPVAVKRITDRNQPADELTAASILPTLYVTAVAVAPRGDWRYGLWGEYGTDTDPTP